MLQKANTIWNIIERHCMVVYYNIVFLASLFYRLARLIAEADMADLFEKPKRSSGVELFQLPPHQTLFQDVPRSCNIKVHKK